MDIAPTLLELGNAAPLPDLMGRSLVPLLEGRGRRQEGVVVSELVKREEPATRVIRGRFWKLRLNGDTGEILGYWDLRADPEERTNLWRRDRTVGKPARKNLRLAESLLALLAERHGLENEAEMDEIPAEILEELKKHGYVGEDE